MKFLIIFVLAALASAAPYPKGDPEAFFNFADLNPTYVFRPSPL
jgi:hypothetical protein